MPDTMRFGTVELLAQTKQTAEFSANLFEAFTLATLIYFTLNMSLMLHQSCRFCGSRSGIRKYQMNSCTSSGLIGLMELLAQTKQTAEFSANLFEAFTLATLIYFTLNMSLMLLMRVVEKKVAVPGLISVGGK